MKFQILKRSLFFFAFSAVLSLFAFSASSSSEAASKAFVQGCRFYSQGQWNSAKIMLKKAVAYPENLNPDTYYMLISAEMNDGDDKAALDDCNVYLESFPKSLYHSQISYQKGKLLYNLGDYEKSIISLSDFCHQNEDSELYSYALFYIGESLFAAYKYEDAKAIFQRIVTDFPDSPKAAAAQYRIETILQQNREEKLLYLLQQTGEEYLSAKEEYEKQLKLYSSENMDTTRQRLEEAQQRNDELQKQVSDLERQISEMRKDSAYTVINSNAVRYTDDVDVPNSDPYDETKEQIKLLKKKALEAQKLMEDSGSGY